MNNANDIIEKHLVFVYAKEQVENIFTRPPLVSFRAGFSLKSIWLGLKYTLFYVNGDHLVVRKADVRLALMLKIETFFRSFATKESYKKNHKFDCDSKCIIYLFSCKACGLQYVVSTVERFFFGWNNYRNCQRKTVQGGKPPQRYFHQHFISEGYLGLLNDFEITLIDKTDSSDPKRRDFFFFFFFFIRLLNTYYPLGLNIEEELKLSFL